MPQDPALLYIRELPGGGYVTIEGQPAAGEDGAPYHGALAIERRSDPDRRAGHEPPVIVEAEAPTQDEVLDRLLAIANSNVAVAAALLRWTAGRLTAASEGSDAPVPDVGRPVLGDGGDAGRRDVTDRAVS